MKAIQFDESNTVLAEDQPQYLPLPVYKTQSGLVVSCWTFESDEERAEFLTSGKLYIQTLTFNNPFQPIMITAENPMTKEEQKHEDK